MKTLTLYSSLIVSAISLAIAPVAKAATITVNTTNAVAGAGEINLAAAIAMAAAGDTIQFNIPGAGPHYLQTPADGYPIITVNNLTLDGYSQPGAVPNTNPILAANNAQIKIVLDSRNGNFRSMGYEPANSNAGFSETEFAVLGIFRATNVTIRGFCLLGVPGAGDNSHYAVAIARDYSGGAPGLGDGAHINGCWIGVDLDRTTVHAFDDGVAAFRHRDDTIGNEARLPSNGHIIGVKAGSASPRSEFNVIVGGTINLILEGQRHRISGNFLGVLPSGTNDYIVPFAEPGRFAESHIEIGRGGSDLVIGTDGDGVNDADERNIFGGVVTDGRHGSFNLGGYRHVLEIYSLSSSPGPERTRIKIAGNYFGIGVDGVTRFTNGVPAMNGSAVGDSEYWIGTDLDGVSDDIEPNLIYNNYPAGLFYTTDYTNSTGEGSGSHGFFDEPNSGALYSVRGNVMVNNYPYPVNPGRNAGAFVTQYVGKALVTTDGGLGPVLSSNSSTTRLIGSIPVANADYPHTILDLYLPDPDGLVNGLVVPDENLTNGWVQGMTYLGSYVENSAADLNAAAGEFEFSISALGLAPGTKVIVSGNYSKDPPETHNGRTLTSLFSPPVVLVEGAPEPFLPGTAESVGLAHVVPDRVVFNTGLDNLNNWEPFISVLGNSHFLIEANTFAENSQDQQRYMVAFQPVAGGNNATGEVFYADDGTPFRGPVNASRQNGNPGRVAGDKRPGARNFISGGEASPYTLTEFQSDNRWSTYPDRYGPDARFGAVQTHSLNLGTMAQTSLSKAIDAISGRITTGTPANLPEVSRFGGELAALDNGNFVVVTDDRSGFHDPSRAAVAVIIAPDGSIVKDTFVVSPGEIWSNVAAHRGGFCARRGSDFFFYDNAGNLKGQSTLGASGIGFDAGRGDGTRIASHINSWYVYLAGRVTETDAEGIQTQSVRIAVWDSRDQSFVTATNVSELNFATAIDRVNLAVDALDRVTVAYEARPTEPAFEQLQTVARVLAFNTGSETFGYLTDSFFAFVNVGELGFRTFRPSVAVTTRQICIAAKGEINLANNPAMGPDSPVQTTFYTVLSHPSAQDDPTPPVGGPAPPDTQVFNDPPGGWTYAFDGSSANAGAAGSGFTSLDGNWSHDNGSDEWDGSPIGAPFDAATNKPGGVSSLEGGSYLRIQDTGDPRDHGFGGEPSNRKVYLGRDITALGASGTVLNSGVTLHFRARVPTTGRIDPLHPDGNPGGAGPQPYPAGGDGYLIHDGGKGNFGVKQAGGGVISFSLATAADTGSAAGLVMNNLNGMAISGTVDSGEAGTANLLALDPTMWHEFWITIQSDTSGGGTHRVDIYIDGSGTPTSFAVTAGSGSDFSGISYIAMGVGSTGQSGALDVDYFRVRIGAVAPEVAPPLEITSISLSETEVTVAWSGGSGPYALQRKASVSDATWMTEAVTTNQTATVTRHGNTGFFRVADLAQTPNLTFSVWMTGAAERPNPVTTTGSGTGILRLEGDRLHYQISYAGLSGAANAAHIHGPANSSTATGVMFPLVPEGGFAVSGMLTGSVTLTASQKATILGGLAYANIHTAANPGGEIRGQVIPTQFQVSLSGDAERPNPVATGATGFGSVSINGNQLTYHIGYSGLSGPATAAHIHAPGAASGMASPIFPLTPMGSFGTSGSLTGIVTLTEAQLANFVDGLAYANIHTAANPGGEIRGQVSPVLTAIPLNAWLNGVAERPNPVITAGSGGGFLNLEGNTLIYRVAFANLSADANGAHIHGPADSATAVGVIVPLSGAAGTAGTLSGSATVSDEIASHLLNGLTYVNIHTGTNPGGEIRGQVSAAQLRTTLTGNAERPTPVVTPGRGWGSFTLVGNQLSYLVTYFGLSAASSAGHIHGPATTEQPASVLIGFTHLGANATSGAFGGSAVAADVPFAAIVDGLTYANIHTSTNPGGEIRGQISYRGPTVLGISAGDAP